MSVQRDAFLSAEGDAWFARNESALAARDWSLDPVCRKVATLPLAGSSSRVLEIGCGEGSRLQYLSRQLGLQVCGVEPSERAVAKAREKGIAASRGTADKLPFAEASFDLVVFGFCLYLCDDRDLFRIALEADRVLAEPGWLLILDFEARAPTYQPYRHLSGILSRKMDYSSMFAWHPAYTLAAYEKFHHANGQWTDDPCEWVGLACLRKHRPPR
jgi:SAM-dependent methyltransferase